MPILNEFSFGSCDCKSTIYVRQWLPDSAPIGVIQICHGISEHIGRYDDFAKFLASNGFVVAGEDHLGHGKSVSTSNKLGYFAEYGGWELVVGDMRKLYERLKEQYGGADKILDQSKWFRRHPICFLMKSAEKL